MTISSDVCLKENEKLFIDAFLLYIKDEPRPKKSNPTAVTLTIF